MSQTYYCTELGCMRRALALTYYCAEHQRRPPPPAPAPAPNPMAALKRSLQAMVPGDRFTMDFYGRVQRFAFEAWEGLHIAARPSSQPWAVVRIPIIDLITFNAITTVEPL